MLKIKKYQLKLLLSIGRVKEAMEEVVDEKSDMKWGIETWAEWGRGA